MDIINDSYQVLDNFLVHFIIKIEVIKWKTRYRNYNELAKKYNCKMSQMSLAWLRTKGVSSPISLLLK